METNVQATNFTIDRKLIAFTKKKASKLYQFYDKILRIEVVFKLENAAGRENKFAELKVDVVGDNMVVKKVCKSFEEAVDLSVRAAERMLIRHKELMRA